MNGETANHCPHQAALAGATPEFRSHCFNAGSIRPVEGAAPRPIVGSGPQPSLNDNLMDVGGRSDSFVEMESSPEPEVCQIQAISPMQARICDDNCNSILRLKDDAASRIRDGKHDPGSS